MAMRKRKLPLIIILILILVSGGFIFLNPAIESLSAYLAKSEQVSANTLLVEGWLPESALESAYEEFKKDGYKYVITTGRLATTEYFFLSNDGCMIFYTNNHLTGPMGTESGEHKIEISAVSELEGENSAHFNVFVNDSLVADFLADKIRREYPVVWRGKLEEIDSIMIQFDNDKVGDFGDRNLFVKEITIDGTIRIPYQYNSEYDIAPLDGKRRIINNYSSIAELAAKMLNSMGIDSTSILAIPCKTTNMNKTLVSALAVRKQLEISDFEVKGINVVSIGTHSRRTWMTFNKVLNETTGIGIIPLPEDNKRKEGPGQLVKILRETIALVYYWFVLIPY